MAEIYKPAYPGDLKFPSNFDVQITKPLDNRLVLDSVEDLYTDAIKAPYQGMVVTIKGSADLYILTSSDEVNAIAANRVWEQVKSSGTSEEVEEKIQEIRDSLGVLTDMVGEPGTESDGPTGIFEEIENLKKSSSGLGIYSIPMMTPDMERDADLDPNVNFDKSEDIHMLVDYGDSDVDIDEVDPNIFHKGIIQDMYRSIVALQAEVTRLRNAFDYGIYSYKDRRTAKSEQIGEPWLADVEAEEPLWAIDPGIGLELVADNSNFNTTLDGNHGFKYPEGKTVTVDESEGSITFEDCIGTFYDGMERDAVNDKLTLAHLNDSKLMVYLVTSSPKIKMHLKSLDNTSITREVDFEPLLKGRTTSKYGFCVVISRKDKTTQSGFNYVYFSVIDYEKDKKLCEGYWDGTSLTQHRSEVNERYTIYSISFDRLTLYRIKFYTKYEDFTEEVIPSIPDERTMYEVAHIAIRSVANTDVLNDIADQLQDNELIWNKKSGTLHIKSDGKIYRIGSNSGKDDDNNNNDTMTDKEIIEALERMGIIVNGVVYEKDENGDDVVKSFNSISMNPIADITFIHQDTGNRFKYSVDSEGNLVGKYAGNDNVEENTIKDLLDKHGNPAGYDQEEYQAVRGFISDYLFRKKGYYDMNEEVGVNSTGDAGKMSDRLRISSFYAPISTDVAHGCTHSFIELENTSDEDIPLDGIYLHFFDASENTYEVVDNVLKLTSDIVHHLPLDGVIKAGSTYLIRGAKHAEFYDESAFIKVKTFDKEWYENGQLLSFEQKEVVLDGGQVDANSPAKAAYRFCLTYGLPELSAHEKLVEANNNGTIVIDGQTKTYKAGTYPTRILNARFIDSCSFSTNESISNQMGTINPWYANGTTPDAAGQGITIMPNSMFRLMFALDPAKQAYNGFNKSDSSRIRYNSANDIQILKLDKEFIGFPHSNEVIKIDRFTPKASFENRNVMTDKSQLDREKPNMVTCSYGVDVYNTRCFNWISCGAFDEYVWLRKQGDTDWITFQSYTKQEVAANEDPTVDNFMTTTTNEPIRKEYSKLVNNTGYARMINRFPGNDVLFTSHKCVVILPDAQDEEEVYEYVVGRPDKDGNPDLEHTNEIYTFTVYPRNYEGRVYQITDQQGFHWIEYQVWAASAEFLNTKIEEEVAAINDPIDEYNRQAVEYNTAHAEEISMGVVQPRELKTTGKVFPILLNTGDMTQSGARINEWLDYYNGGICLFNHMEQMNCVGNNDLCPINPRELGTGDDTDKSSSHFFHYFYCFDVKDTEKYYELDQEGDLNGQKKFFNGETLVVKAHTGQVIEGDTTTNINVTEDKFIPSFYYFKTNKVLYVIVNSEIPYSNMQYWYGLCSTNKKYVSLYTGIEIFKGGNGNYAGRNNCFTPLYETMYAWLKSNDDLGNAGKKVVVAMHEMPFTVITKASLKNGSDASSITQLPYTRNYPTGTSRLGSNINQVDTNENRGSYWCSRLLEYFNCKLVIGGHKHTYALSYPIREKYTWTLNGGTPKDSGSQMKTMLPTLEDEAGENPTCLISWDIDVTTTSVQSAYNISTSVPEGTKLNSTKAPYIPQGMYSDFGENIFNTKKGSLFRCCTPLAVSDGGKYDHFVTYSMCQATGYKLKSNKELPSEVQVFSKIIPKTTHNTDGSDKPYKEQLYPMYCVLEFNEDCSELNVYMNRITGIFESNGKDKFGQGVYGKDNPVTNQMLYTGTDIPQASRLYGDWKSESTVLDRPENDRYLHIKF